MKFDNLESPIHVIQKQIELQKEEMIMKAIQEVGIVVDKDELIRCMQYDRGQYEKGYQQGRADSIEEYMNALCDKCIQQQNECLNAECPFADDECQIIKIAEQLKDKE